MFFTSLSLARAIPEDDDAKKNALDTRSTPPTNTNTNTNKNTPTHSSSS